jgi:hypothetical protein
VEDKVKEFLLEQKKLIYANKKFITAQFKESITGVSNKKSHQGGIFL